MWSASIHCKYRSRLPIFVEICVGAGSGGSSKTVVSWGSSCQWWSVINSKACSQDTMRYSSTCILFFITDVLFVWTAAQLVWADQQQVRLHLHLIHVSVLHHMICHHPYTSQGPHQQYSSLSFECPMWWKNNQTSSAIRNSFTKYTVKNHHLHHCSTVSLMYAVKPDKHWSPNKTACLPPDRKHLS